MISPVFLEAIANEEEARLDCQRVTTLTSEYRRWHEDRGLDVPCGGRSRALFDADLIPGLSPGRMETVFGYYARAARIEWRVNVGHSGDFFASPLDPNIQGRGGSVAQVLVAKVRG